MDLIVYTALAHELCKGVEVVLVNSYPSEKYNVLVTDLGQLPGIFLDFVGHFLVLSALSLELLDEHVSCKVISLVAGSVVY